MLFENVLGLAINAYYKLGQPLKKVKKKNSLCTKKGEKMESQNSQNHKRQKNSGRQKIETKNKGNK